MKRLVLLLVAVFLLGALTGAAAVRVYVVGILRGFLDGPPEQLVDQPMMFLLERRIGFSPDQRRRALEILASHREELRAIHRTKAPALIELRRREADELMPILDDGQKARLEALFQEMSGRVRRWLDLPDKTMRP